MTDHAHDDHDTPPERLPVSEFLGIYQGANSPFGDDLEFPLPAEQLRRSDPHD